MSQFLEEASLPVFLPIRAISFVAFFQAAYDFFLIFLCIYAI